MNQRKIVSLLTVVAMLLTMWAVPVTVSAEPLSDVVGTEYEKPVSLLETLNIVTGYEDGTFKPDNTVTRAEFTAMVARMLRGGLSGSDNEGAQLNDQLSEKDPVRPNFNNLASATVVDNTAAGPVLDGTLRIEATGETVAPISPVSIQDGQIRMTYNEGQRGTAGVEIGFNAAKAGKKTLTISYDCAHVAAATGDILALVSVNGGEAQSISMPSNGNGYWGRFQTYSMTIDAVKGANTIKIASNFEQTWEWFIDYIELSDGVAAADSAAQLAAAPQITIDFNEQSKINVTGGNVSVNTTAGEPPAVFGFGAGTTTFEVVDTTIDFNIYDQVTFRFGTSTQLTGYSNNELFLYVDGDPTNVVAGVTPVAGAADWVDIVSLTADIEDVEGKKSIGVGFNNTGHYIRLMGIDFTSTKGDIEVGPTPAPTTKPVDQATITPPETEYQEIPAGAVFADVSDDHWAAADVRYAKGLGLVNGFGNNMFWPDYDVTLEQAVKILVCATNWGQVAEYKGGYPIGYMTVGAEIGLLDGMKTVDGPKAASRGQIAQLMYNALFADYLTYEAVSSAAAQLNDSTTVLEEIFNVVKVKGVVQGTPLTNLDIIDNDIEDGEVQIGNAIYATDDETVYNLLGYNVDAYVKYEKDQDATVLAAFPTSKNTAVEISLDDLVSVSASQIKVENPETGKAIEYNISGADIIYNGRAYTGTNVADILQPNHGSVSILSNNGSKRYNVVFVEDYTMGVVSSVKSSKETINFIDGSVLDLSEEGENDGVKTEGVAYYRSGEEASFSTIKVGDILAIGANDGYYTVNIYRGNDYTVKGDIDVKKADTVTIKGEEFGIANGAKYTNLLTLGANVKVYLDGANKIFYVEKGSDTAGSNYPYGALLDAMFDDQDAFAETILLKVLKTDSSIEALKLADEVKVDGEKKITATDAQAILNTLKANAIGITGEYATYAQVIKYKTNADGEVTAIETKAILGMDAVAGAFRQGGVLTTRGKNYGVEGVLSFVLPVGDDDAYDCRVERITGDRYGTNMQLDYYVYEINEDNVPGCAIVVSTVGTSSSENHATTTFAIFDSAEEVWIEDGEDEYAATQINFWRDGVKQSRIVDEEKTTLVEAVMNMFPGDMFVCAWNADGELTSLINGGTLPRIAMVGSSEGHAGVRYDDILQAVEQGTYIYAQSDVDPGAGNALGYETILAPVVKKDGNKVTVQDGSGNRRTITLGGTTYINTVTKENGEYTEGEIKKGSANDIGVGDMIFLQMWNGGVRTVMLFDIVEE